MKKYIVFIIAVLDLGSCVDLDKSPLDSPSTFDFPKSRIELETAVNGAYNSLYKRDGGYLQDELFWDNATDLGYIRGGYESTEGILGGRGNGLMFTPPWKHGYSGIQRANLILENMERARTRIDEDICNRAEAEVKFIRAYHYMHLTERYGDVPFVETSISINESKLPRTPKAEIVSHILTDLEEAANILPEKYEGENVGKITKGAAYALKARIALYNKEYEMAKEAALKVMKLGCYELHPNYGDLFQLEGNGSKEIIFQLSYHKDVYCNNDHVFLGGKGGTGNWSIAVPSQMLVDSYLCIDGKPINESSLYNQKNPFENRDPRLKQSIIVPQTWFGDDLFETHPDSIETWRKENGILKRIQNLEVTNPYATFTGYLWRKNCDETQFWKTWAEEGVLPLKVIRYGEVLLTYAEACIELNQIDATVYKAINDLRDRVDMPHIPQSLDQSAFRKVVRNERKIELAGEGFRLYDIRRWAIAEYVIPGNMPGRKKKEYWFNPGIPTFDEYGHPHYENQSQVYNTIQVRKFDKNRDYLWAIPQFEIDLNPNLTQNKGY